MITQTAKVHAAAWKRLFDEYLRDRAQRLGEPFRPFDIEADYRQYVDGKLRYDGVRSFLESRGIHLPEGSSDDPPGAETVRGLGNLKDLFFTEHLAAHGVEVYESTLALIRNLRRAGVKTAVVSSSKNCVPVLRAADALDLFDRRVDGNDSERLGLQGKPAPDIFLEAVRRLGVEPVCAIVVEDAIAGVQAGRAGRFGTVIGVDRTGQPGRLSENGADVVVNDLSQIRVNHPGLPEEADSSTLASALEHLDEILCLTVRRRLAVFLDYDGTLTPIVARPEDALISEAMRQAVKALASKCTVAVVSGRDLRDVRSLVGLEGIFYAGSHGFEIAGPEDWQAHYEQGTAFLPLLDTVQRELEMALAGMTGAQVERKKYSIAAHYRNVRPGDEAHLRRAVEGVLSAYKQLRVSAGKKVYDIQPDIDWNKGKAVLWLLDVLELDSCATVPVYIGDDTTDEDAFRALHDRGVGIVVRDEPRQTVARYALDSTAEVERFLGSIAAKCSGDSAR